MIPHPTLPHGAGEVGRGDRPDHALVRDARGGALVELALALPLLVLLAMGVFEASRYVVLNLKLDNVAGTVGDLVARSPQLTEADVAAMLGAADDIAAPFDIFGRGAVVVSSVGRKGGQEARVNWQRRAGAWSGDGAVGREGRTATLPGGLTLEPDETAVVAEVVYGFTPAVPALAALFPPTELHHAVVLRPRFGDLAALEP
ncbi:TadE/TadG family type IV pilus assembly protein [Azospirillum sp. ST 5-10]|uniref:TadE/TadG family type IV pilus assembly protein n=1 Tax=unclassified Azospirillum TaxID=2630922 RepID=UPI003F49F8EE